MQRQLDCKVSNNTVNKYNCDYKRFFQDSSIELEEISSITDEMLYSFLVNRIKQKNYLNRAAKSMFGMLNGIFTKTKKDKIIQDNPCKYIDFPTLRKHCCVQTIKM